MREVEISDEVAAILPDSFLDQFVKTAAEAQISCAKCVGQLPAGDDTPVAVVVCVDADLAKRDKLTQAVLVHTSCMESGIWEVEGLFDEYNQTSGTSFRVALGQLNDLPLALFEPTDLAMAVADHSGDLSDSWITEMLGSGMAMMLALPKPDEDTVPSAEGWTVRRDGSNVIAEFTRPDVSEPGFVVLSDDIERTEDIWAQIQDKGGVVLVTGTSLGILEDNINAGVQDAIQYGRAAWGFAKIA